ncbi:hypothetical protein D9K79_14970 [Acinetobacter cumulans]|uniref:Uncharacterized protein n=1 Tax=Acinetobacter cumulans TaxID=2136182 RepID=A0ABX9U2S6_9GAMM|nr:hypothetical protein [Acinetobacter cumulans]RLL39565.1 hypothetical protein D9K79_14970 [Acinetobacter cumulans]
MKKIVALACVVLGSFSVVQAASVEQYVMAVEKINENYKKDTRNFFVTLDPMQRGFSVAQQEKFCGIVAQYAQDLYATADKNRSALDPKYANLTKQDVNQQVLSAKEMQMLKQYNVQCTLN